jgi:hypothetical protein
MKIFEFIFNPKLKKDLIFDSFCYKPENIYEKNKGHLCMVGLLKNSLPTNIYLIKKIARMIKDVYFKSPDSNLHSCFKSSLKKVNDFLLQKSDSGNTSWLGNLSFLALSLKGRKLFFSKTGDIKILVVRNKDIIDIDEKTKYNEVSPYPIKVFARTISSKLSKKDLVLIFTREVYDYFKEKNLLEKIIDPVKFNEKEIRKILDKRKKEIVDVKGVFLGISLKDFQEEASKKTTLKKLTHVPWKKMYSSFFKNIKKKKLPKIKFPSKKQKKLKLKAFQKDLSFFSRQIKPFFKSKKALFLIPFLLIVIGFSFYSIQKNNQIKAYQEKLSNLNYQATVTIEKLNNETLTPNLTKEIDDSLQNYWLELLSIEEESNNISEELTNSINESKIKIQSSLYELNNVEEIISPNLFFSFENKSFSPNKILFFDEKLYSHNLEDKKLIFINSKKELKEIKINKQVNSVSFFDDSLILFSKPNQVTILKNNFPTSYLLNKSEIDGSYDFFSTFANNLYFLDQESGKIIKHGYSGNLKWSSASNWLFSDSDREKNKGADSFTIDRSIWVLNNNLILEYYTGDLRQEIRLETFPKIKKITKIFSSPELSNIYILEPAENRIIIMDKKGEIKTQFISQQFNNLLDLAVDQNEESLFLLNGKDIYKINL